MHAYKHLENLFRELFHLEHVTSICHWDEAVMMPKGGGEARAEALATLKSLRHALLVKPQVADWILQAKTEHLDSSWQQMNLYWMEREYLKAVCLPTELVQRSTLAFIRCEQAWRRLRTENNWEDFAPFLQENIILTKEIAQIKANTFGMSAYDCLIDDYSPGLSQHIIDPIFNYLRNFLPDFLQQVITMQSPCHTIIGNFPIENQRKLSFTIMKTLGFNFEHGRLDVSHHPFCGGVPEDVRITTRFKEEEFMSAAMAVCHETGHALYERGLPNDWLNQPVGKALGMAMHESQSLLMEMQACRSMEFMEYLSKQVKASFGDKILFSPENLHHNYTYVKPGLIRVDADEVSYPLHIIMRYELEKQLIEGDIAIINLPEYWDNMTQRFFGISTKDNYRDGIMQDVHWPCGAFGYFPAYTIGAIIAAQLFQTAKKQHPNLLTDIASGDFTSLVDWLKQNVHCYGRKLFMMDLLKVTTGEELKVDAFIKHLHNRYLSN